MFQNGGVYFELDSYFMNPVGPIQNILGIDQNSLTNKAFFISYFFTFTPQSQFIWRIMEVYSSQYQQSISTSSSPSQFLAQNVITQVYFDEFFNTTKEDTISVVHANAFRYFTQSDVVNQFEITKIETVNDKVKELRSEVLSVKMWSNVTRNLEITQVSVAYGVMNQFCILCNIPLN